MNEPKVAYICDGMVPECSGKVGCYKYTGAAFDENAICSHTNDPEHAFYGASDNPESEVPERFKKIDGGVDFQYFEETQFFEEQYYNQTKGESKDV